MYFNTRDSYGLIARILHWLIFFTGGRYANRWFFSVVFAI